MIVYRHGKTSSYRCKARRQGTRSRHPDTESGGTPGRPSRVAAGRGPYHLGTNRRHLGRGSGDRPPPPAAVSTTPTARRAAPALGWSPPGPVDTGARTNVLGTLDRASPASGAVGGFAPPCGAVSATGTSGRGVGGLSVTGAARLAQSRAGYAPSQERCGGPRGLEKKLPETLAAMLTQEAVQGRRSG